MFRYSLFLDTLFKAMTHKYIRRVPKGVTKTGKTKYVYFYAGQEGHGKGIGHESELVQGSSFAFGEVGKTRYHAHITKVDGDKVTVKYDDGDKKGTEETMTKKQFQALVHGEHKANISLSYNKAKKQLEDFIDMRKHGRNVTQETIDKLQYQVSKLSYIVSEDKDSVDINAPWMTEKQRIVFEGQNNVLKMLSDKELFKTIIQDKNVHNILIPMLDNVQKAVFKYKDVSIFTPEQKALLSSVGNSLSIAYRINIEKSPELQKQLFDLLVVLSDVWDKLPYSKQQKVNKIGNINVLDTDTHFDTKTKDIVSETIIHEATKKAQDILLDVNKDFNKFIYGDIFSTDYRISKVGAPDILAQYKRAPFQLSDILRSNQGIYAYVHDPDFIYVNKMLTPIDNTCRNLWPEKDFIPYKQKHMTSVIVHELTHRLTNDLEKNEEYVNDIKKLFSTAKSLKINVDNRPLKEYMSSDNGTFYVLDAISQISRFYGSFKEKEVYNSNTGTNIPISSVDLVNIMESKFIRSPYDPMSYDLVVPLKDKTELTLALSMPAPITNGFPSIYAKENISEFASEIMPMICTQEYSVEPIKTEFLNIINKYLPNFGKM